MDTGEMAEETSCQRASSSGPSSRPLFSPLHAWRISPESSRPDWNCCSPSWIGTLIFFHVLKKYSVKRFEPLICSPPVMIGPWGAEQIFGSLSRNEHRRSHQFSISFFFTPLRLETRMTTDITVILQLLQRQIPPVPPAYSDVSPSLHSPHPSMLYNAGASMIHTSAQMDSSARLLQVRGVTD